MSSSRAHASDAQADADLAFALPGRNRLNHLLWEASQRAYAFSEPVLSEMQLSLPSVGTLEMIAACPGITASELARVAFKTQQAMSQVTGRLERLGYVERRVGAGRGVGLHITRLGSDALAAGIAGEEAVEDRLQELLGPELYEQVRGLLAAVRDRLTEATDTDPAAAAAERAAVARAGVNRPSRAAIARAGVNRPSRAAPHRGG